MKDILAAYRKAWAEVDECYAEETNWIDLDALDAEEKEATKEEDAVTTIMEKAAQAMKAAKRTAKGKVNKNSAWPIQRKAKEEWQALKGTHDGFWDTFNKTMKDHGVS